MTAYLLRHVKKHLVALLVLILLFTGLPMPLHALSDTQTAAIQTLLEEAVRISRTPGISITIVDGEETVYMSAGYANRADQILASQHTLYELASVSKAYTATGILLLEEQGLLNMTDPIEKYLPWFTLNDRGVPLTLNHFLHHTSGLTNSSHALRIPEGRTPDMLRKTVEALVGAELDFTPGEAYNYGTVNYDVLGLVIEVVSKQSYERFMTEQVFQPLGLHDTYLYKEDAQATGRLAQGYRTSFFVTTPYDAPDFGGNKPAGYIISTTTDLARWLRIQLGAVPDIPDKFKSIITRSHQGDKTVPLTDGMSYAAGWMVNTEGTILMHDGGNPNYATKVIVFPKEQIAIGLLSNHADMNIELVTGIKEIVAGNASPSYTRSSVQLWDMILSGLTILFCLLAFILFVQGVYVQRKGGKSASNAIRRKRTIWLTVIIVLNALFYLLFPRMIGTSWSSIFVWQSYSMLTAFTALSLLTVSIVWFVFCHRGKIS